MAEASFEVLWPLGRAVYETSPMANREADLKGKTVCEIWDWLFRGDEVFPIVRELFMISLLMFALLLLGCTPAAAPGPTGTPLTQAPNVLGTPAASKPAPTAAPNPSPKAAAGQPKRGGVLRVAVTADPRTYDLHGDISITVLGPLGPAYNGIVEYDDSEPDKIVGGLAEKWEASDDGKKFTFHMRNGVKWHDGKALTALDAEFSLKRIKEMSPNLKEPISFMDNVQATNDADLVVTLKEPRAIFMRLLADNWAAILPNHVIQAQGDMKRTVVGTGPFKFKSHDVGASLQLVRNPDYFVKDKPYLDGITYYPIRDAGTALAAFRSKRVDLMGVLVVTNQGAQVIEREEPNARVGQYRSSGWWNFFMPLDKAPWNNLKVRQAVHLALDRDAFVKIVDQGNGTIGSFIPQVMGGPAADELRGKPGFRQPKDADRAEAKKLLQEAGYANGFSTKILHRTGEPFQSAAVLLKSQLATIGVDAELDPHTEADLYEIAYRSGYNSFMLRTGWKIPDPDGLLPTYYMSGAASNFGHMNDPEIDKLIDQQSVTTDAQKRKEILKEIDRRLTENLPSTVTHWSNYIVAWWPTSFHYVMPLTITSNVRHANSWLVK